MILPSLYFYKYKGRIDNNSGVENGFHQWECSMLISCFLHDVQCNIFMPAYLVLNLSNNFGKYKASYAMPRFLTQILSSSKKGLRMRCHLEIIINGHIRRDRGKRIMCFYGSYTLLTKRFTHNNEKLWRNQDDWLWAVNSQNNFLENRLEMSSYAWAWAQLSAEAAGGVLCRKRCS